MAQGQHNHLTNLCHLLTAATDVIISNFLGIIFVIPVDGLTFIEQSGGGRNNTILERLKIVDLELDSTENNSDQEGVILLHRAVAILEVRDQVSFGGFPVIPSIESEKVNTWTLVRFGI